MTTATTSKSEPAAYVSPGGSPHFRLTRLRAASLSVSNLSAAARTSSTSGRWRTGVRRAQRSKYFARGRGSRILGTTSRDRGHGTGTLATPVARNQFAGIAFLDELGEYDQRDGRPAVPDLDRRPQALVDIGAPRARPGPPGSIRAPPLPSSSITTRRLWSSVPAVIMPELSRQLVEIEASRLQTSGARLSIAPRMCRSPVHG